MRYAWATSLYIIDLFDVGNPSASLQWLPSNPIIGPSTRQVPPLGRALLRTPRCVVMVSMSNRIPMTSDGYVRLEQELQGREDVEKAFGRQLESQRPNEVMWRARPASSDWSGYSMTPLPR